VLIITLSSWSVSSHARFSPNSKFVLVSTQDSTIRLWNYSTSHCAKTYVGHVNRTYCIPSCFLLYNRGKFIISGSEDNKVYIWNMQTRHVVQHLDGHRGMNEDTVTTWTLIFPSRYCSFRGGALTMIVL